MANTFLKRRGALPKKFPNWEKSQHEFLKMVALELELTVQELAVRMGTPWRTFEKWLYADDALEYRSMPGAIWVLGNEILAHERLKQDNHK